MCPDATAHNAVAPAPKHNPPTIISANGATLSVAARSLFPPLRRKPFTYICRRNRVIAPNCARVCAAVQAVASSATRAHLRARLSHSNPCPPRSERSVPASVLHSSQRPPHATLRRATSPARPLAILPATHAPQSFRGRRSEEHTS